MARAWLNVTKINYVRVISSLLFSSLSYLSFKTSWRILKTLGLFNEKDISLVLGWNVSTRLLICYSVCVLWIVRHPYENSPVKKKYLMWPPFPDLRTGEWMILSCSITRRLTPYVLGPLCLPRRFLSLHT